ncbi:hypothetical protein Q1695_013009 [Nippostrongylus brasiliensis]|nr:hypothetical protein Q1695_013009 [Nippostrongylus brasiliensis]
MIALTLSLGSGLPIGREGPFVHIASVVANQLSRFQKKTDGVFENESRATEMLAAGCAVGVACTFTAPVGGVLFSIEVTAAYFAVRNYWRGFFAATCSATLFSVLQGLRRGAGSGWSAWTDLLSVSMQAHYQTNFSITDLFTSSELIAFGSMGFICGVFGAIFIFLHRKFVLFLRRNKYMKHFLQKYWLLYPALLSFAISSITYPLGAGKYLGGEQTFAHTLNDFFISCSWMSKFPGPCPRQVNQSWIGPDGDISVFYSLLAFQITFFVLAIIASTLPIPSGIFMPVFVLGGAFGRAIGEFLVLWYPTVTTSSGAVGTIHPGIYAVVGAAAFCGAVTHTVSVAVIVFELTGQLVLLIPVMIAVLIANAVCSYLQPSIYDSIIKIKRLPYLPNISHNSSMYHCLTAEQFMTTPVAFIGKDSTYAEVQEVIMGMSHVKAFPLVENRHSMSLLGSVSRSQLFKLTQSKLGVKARQAEAALRISQAISDVSRRYRVSSEVDLLAARLSPDNTSNEKKETSRFTVNPVPVNNGVTKKMNSFPSDANFLSVPNPMYGLPATDHAGDILAMGMKRSHSSNDQDSMRAEFYHTIGDVFRSITRKGIGRGKKERDHDFDLHGDEREEWESKVLKQTVDLTNVQIDPSPFQLVGTTSLFKAGFHFPFQVHSLFSLLGLKRAYVTRAGQLVGVISLHNLRSAIENVQSGDVPANGEAMLSQKSSLTESDDVDYLHPQLEVLTRPNTCTDLSLMNGTATTKTDSTVSKLSRRASEAPRAPPPHIQTSLSDPCFQRRRSSIDVLQNQRPLFDLPRIRVDERASDSSSQASNESVSRRQPTHVRIMIPEDSESSQSDQVL